jgi:hypothetical protein
MRTVADLDDARAGDDLDALADEDLLGTAATSSSWLSRILRPRSNRVTCEPKRR